MILNHKKPPFEYSDDCCSAHKSEDLCSAETLSQGAAGAGTLVPGARTSRSSCGRSQLMRLRAHIPYAPKTYRVMLTPCLLRQPVSHTGCYPTVPQPKVLHIPLKRSSTTHILATRQLPPSLQALTITLPTQGPGSSPLLETSGLQTSSHGLVWLE